MYASNEYPEETAQARKLVLAFTTGIHTCDKYQHFMNWPIKFHNINPLSDDSLTHTFANIEEPDAIPHNVTFHQGLHCL